MNALRARRLSAWIAIFAMALAALAPTVSRALARGAASPVSWTEVCTASGMQWVNLESGAIAGTSGPRESQPAQSATLDHCPFCLLSADRLGPPSSPPSAFRLHGEAVTPAVRPAPLFLSLAPLAAHARGPPLNTVPPSVASGSGRK